MLSLLLAALGPANLASVALTPDAPGDRPPVKLWINSDRTFRPGEAVKVEVETGLRGHLLVLQYENDGTLRVLFPRSPVEETWVLADRRYSLRGEFENASFVAQGDGPGLIFTAISEVPWRFEGFVGAGGWDYQALSVPRDEEDVEGAVTELVQRMAGPRGFDYDILDYLVVSSSVTIVAGRPGASYWYPVWIDPYSVYLMPDYWGHRPWGGRSSFYFSFGYGPTWYWPSYWYRPWHYSYYGYNPYYPPYWGGQYYPRHGPVVTVPRDRAVVVGRPRGYHIEPNRPRPGTADRAGRPAVPQADRGGKPEARPGSGEARPSARGTDRSRGRPSGDERRPERQTRPAAEQPPVQIERSRPERARTSEWVRSEARPATPAPPDRRVVTSRPARPTASTVDRSRGITARGPDRPVARRVERPSSNSQGAVFGRPSSGSSSDRAVRGSTSGSRSGGSPSVSRSPAPSRPSVSRPAPSSSGRSASSGSSSSRSRGSSGSSGRSRKP